MQRAVLFDLDGTLVDTLHDIAVAMNQVLEAAGLPTHLAEKYREYVGWGARDLVVKSLPEGSDADVDELLAGFRERYYGTPLGTSALYPGVAELLGELEARDVPMGILTNKPEEPAHLVVAGLMADVPFREVRGAREGVPHKPDPTALLELAEAMGVAPQHCFYLGDTEIDIQTARAAGMVPVGVAWGFRPDSLEGADHILPHPSDLLRLL